MTAANIQSWTTPYSQ